MAIHISPKLYNNRPNAEEYRLECLTTMYVKSELTLQQFEDLTSQALKGQQPTLSGLPIMADPNLFNFPKPKFDKIYR